jgi:hypothetical protein
VPTFSENVFLMNPKLTLSISEHGKPSLKQQNTMNVRITILKRLKNPATRNLTEFPTNVSHKLVELDPYVSPSISK